MLGDDPLIAREEMGEHLIAEVGLGNGLPVKREVKGIPRPHSGGIEIVSGQRGEVADLEAGGVLRRPRGRVGGPGGDRDEA